ncbi:helix-turn-helix transcriptional regulator [Vibrio tapetis subsp. quintayensis]|uniref:AraC family transcriptional regulator n=1 Tax=Vibrio tapetis TaxID=52443 RepID=UPI0025B32517|nr:helix-turn-helix transcriptional regulator [Vibrio tapetis]MDN3681023.1 helix-turn-helix transcriptional regulator [Vibrio tapetis subsp. quintayensis]
MHDIPEVGFNHNKTNNAEFEVVDLSKIQTDHSFNVGNPSLPHRINFFNLIYIEEGSGSHLIDFVDYPFESGSFIFVQVNQVHAFDFSQQPKGKAILFTQRFLDQLHQNMRVPEFTPTHLDYNHRPVVSVEKELQKSIKVLLSEMETEILRPNSDPLIVMYLFSSLALMFHRIRPETHHQKLSPEQMVKFSKFIELLQTHFNQVRDANWYAEQIFTTYKTLNLVCKVATNLTVKQLIDAYTILEAKRRLVISQISTQQLAYELGFDDVSNFIKYFKKNTLITPSRFQKMYRTPNL